MGKYSNFIGLYPVQKTLKMGLLPVGNTLENIQKEDILDKDELLAANYTKVKQLLDKYHKNLIEQTLNCLKLDKDLLDEYAGLLNDLATKKTNTRISKTQDLLRLAVSKAFTSNEKFSSLWKKDMITVLLPQFLTDEEDLNTVAVFANHTGYFSDYFSCRKSLYESKELVGSVAYRIVHENFPIFVRNMGIIRLIVQDDRYQELRNNFSEIFQNFNEYLNVQSLDEMFETGYFTDMLSQSQIEVYNLMLGGRIGEDGVVVPGLNQYINIFNSRCDAKDRLPLLDKMKKMILSDREILSWLTDKFEDDNTLLNAVAECCDELQYIFYDDKGPRLVDLIENMKSFNLKGIYVRQKMIKNLSNAVYGDWRLLQDALIGAEKKNIRRTARMTDEAFNKKAAELYKKQASFSLHQMMEAAETLDDRQSEALTRWLDRKNRYEDKNVFVKLKAMRRKANWLLDVNYPEEKNLIADTKAVAAIKDVMDAVKDIKYFVQMFLAEGNEENRDVEFYNRLMPAFEKIAEMDNLYNKVRNYLTRKPYSEKKMKLNFSYSNILGGWDADKLTENGCFLLRKDNDVFLAVVKKGCKIALDKMQADKCGDNNYERIYYKQITGAFRMLPKVFFSKKWIQTGICVPSSSLMAKYTEGRHLKGEKFDLDFCHELIDYFKKCCKAYTTWDCYNLTFSDTNTFADISQFYAELEKQTYSITFQPIAASNIDELVEAGSVYLFKIYNRDLSAHAKGRKALQTLYYQMLFDKRNLDNLVIKLNGGAAMYYRKASIHPDKPTHPAGVPMKNKNPLSERSEATYAYPLTKNYRYTRDTFHFHFPVTINCNSLGMVNVNQLANQWIRQTDDLHIIGINRGERNLIYVTVIDMQGHIVEQKSLNIISSESNGVIRRTDYHELLTRRENERAEARESWMSGKNIADLKEGYLSAAIQEIVRLLDKYNAVIALEDLSDAFINKRKHIEIEIYRKFEDMLVAKLNYLADKKKQEDEPGGILRGYQLTAKAEDMNGYSRQNGILFRVPSWYIGLTCPVTGFINFIKLKYTNVQDARKFIDTLGDIRYNADSQWFEFDLDDSRFTDKTAGARTEWTLCSAGTRIFKGETVNLTKEFFELFNRFGLNVYGDLKKEILVQDSKDFFEKFIGLTILVLQMRNVDNNGSDYLVSPVKDKEGKVFMSTMGKKELPLSCDANDAYNLARKCLVFVNQIKSSDEQFVKLSLSNKEWMQFVQES